MVGTAAGRKLSHVASWYDPRNLRKEFIPGEPGWIFTISNDHGPPVRNLEVPMICSLIIGRDANAHGSSRIVD